MDERKLKKLRTQLGMEKEVPSTHPGLHNQVAVSVLIEEEPVLMPRISEHEAA